MFSLALKKLFKTKSDKSRNSDGKKTREAITKHTSKAKATSASITASFCCSSRVRTEPLTSGLFDADALFDGTTVDLFPLPQIPRVASTLRRDLAQLKLKPLTFYDDDEENAGDAISPNVPLSVAVQTICHKPAALQTVQRKPLPATNVCFNGALACIDPSRDSFTIAQQAEDTTAASKASRPERAAGFATKPQTPHAQLPMFAFPSSSPGSTISLSQFPLPPKSPTPQQTSPTTYVNSRTPVQVAHDAMLAAPTAEAAQQALINYADAYAINDTRNSTLRASDAFSDHSQGSSGETAFTIYTPPHDEEWLSLVGRECADLIQMVAGHHQARVSRDARRQNDMVRNLKRNEAKVTADIETLNETLAETQNLLKFERTKRQEYSQQVNDNKKELVQLYKATEMLTRERDTARQIAEQAAAVATSTGNANQKLVVKIASSDYILRQARIVIENQDNFHRVTGRTGEEWQRTAVNLNRDCQSLCSSRDVLEKRNSELALDLAETAQLLTQTTAALKKAEAEAWAYQYSVEEIRPISRNVTEDALGVQ